MDLIPILIAVPALMAVILPFIREVKIRELWCTLAPDAL